MNDEHFENQDHIYSLAHRIDYKEDLFGEEGQMEVVVEYTLPHEKESYSEEERREIVKNLRRSANMIIDNFEVNLLPEDGVEVNK